MLPLSSLQGHYYLGLVCSGFSIENVITPMFYGSFEGSEVDDGYCRLVSRDDEGAN